MRWTAFGGYVRAQGAENDALPSAGTGPLMRRRQPAGGTPHEYVDAIITEVGVVRPPYVANLRAADLHDG